MKYLLECLFSELGLIDYAQGVRVCNHAFSLRNYMSMFEYEIKRNDLIVSTVRAKEMRLEYICKKGESLYGGIN